MNIKCMLGFHDWEVCRTSDIVGYTGFSEKIAVYKEDCCRGGWFDLAEERVCLRCGKMDNGINKCFEEAEKRLKEKWDKQEKIENRKQLAKDLCNMGE